MILPKGLVIVTITNGDGRETRIPQIVETSECPIDFPVKDFGSMEEVHRIALRVKQHHTHPSSKLAGWPFLFSHPKKRSIFCVIGGYPLFTHCELIRHIELLAVDQGAQAIRFQVDSNDHSAIDALTKREYSSATFGEGSLIFTMTFIVNINAIVNSELSQIPAGQESWDIFRKYRMSYQMDRLKGLSKKPEDANMFYEPTREFAHLRALECAGLPSDSLEIVMPSLSQYVTELVLNCNPTPN